MRKVLPDDIADFAESMHIAELANHYGWSRHTMRVVLKRDRPDQFEKAIENGKESQRVIGRLSMQTENAKAAIKRRAEQRAKKVETPFVPVEKVKLAMNYLRRWGSCYPLSVREPGREGYWFYGREWSDSELMAEAKRRGWVPLDEMVL